jgi:hypothetical protein
MIIVTLTDLPTLDAIALNHWCRTHGIDPCHLTRTSTGSGRWACRITLATPQEQQQLGALLQAAELEEEVCSTGA